MTRDTTGASSSRSSARRSNHEELSTTESPSNWPGVKMKLVKFGIEIGWGGAGAPGESSLATPAGMSRLAAASVCAEAASPAGHPELDRCESPVLRSCTQL